MGLHLQARKLESELDVKLSSFRRGGTPKDGQGDGSETEIERLLQQLNEVNKHMQNWVSNAGSIFTKAGNTGGDFEAWQLPNGCPRESVY